MTVPQWWGGGPCDFSVSPSPFGLDFGTLDFGLGLENYQAQVQVPIHIGLGLTR